MKIIAESIKNPISVLVGVILVLLFGFIALYKIPVQLTPDVEKPQITVSTAWPGGSPQEVETEIVREQEEELKTVEGLVEMTSESSDSLGNIVLQFRVGTDLDAALVNVSNKLDQVAQYPADADKPVISSVDVAGSAMAWFILKPAEGSALDIDKFHDFADDFIKPRFERVPGVGSSNVYGGTEREMQVIVDPNALAARGVSLIEMAQAIDGENNNFSAGDFEEGKRRYIVRTVGEYKSPEDIEKVVIKRVLGAPVYVRDVARARLGYRDASFAVRQNGAPAIAVNAVKESGANTINVMTGLRAAMDELNSGILKDRGLILYNVYDETEYIGDAIELVQHDVLIGSILAVAILLLFLRSLTSTFIISAAIPISIIGTFIAMAFLGRTFNVVSLAGMGFAIGIFIDNSIVVLENIYRHLQMGKSRAKAALDGASEVWGAILASTLTNVAVFLPVIFVEEQAGQLFRDIAIAITFSVLLNLVVSITLIPTLSAKILSVSKEQARPAFGNLWGYADFAQGIANRISALVERIITKPSLRLATILAFTFGSIFLSWAMIPKMEYLPEGNRNLLFGILLPPPGYNIQEFELIGLEIERDLAPYWEAKPGSQEAKNLDGPLIRNFFYVAAGRQVFMGAIAENPSEVRGLFPVLQGALNKIPGMIAIVTQASLFERGFGEGRAVDIQITGPELERLVELGQKVFFSVLQNFPDAQARPIPSLDLGNPEIQVITDRVRASDVGITNRELGFTVNALVDGAIVSDYIIEGDEIDLVLRGEDGFAARTQDIENLLINTPIGSMVTVGSIADVKLANGPEQINHFERQRTITIQLIPNEKMPLETALQKINETIVAPLRQGGDVGGAYNITLAGTADDLTVAREAFEANFILAAVITFLLMAALYESFLYSLVIMFSVPLASFGGFLGLFFLNRFIYQPLDILTLLGFIILVGTVVNNAILIVHQSLNYMNDEGMDVKQAIVESVRTRIRPIFMSTTTGVFGMLPLVIIPGAGSELYRGLGSVVLGGLVVSTVFTLVLVPAVFSFAYDAKASLSAKIGRLFPALGKHPSK
ncbi:MAG: efflux RND transporter permease subunit [Deltaproteobacteria bacterium]